MEDFAEFYSGTKERLYSYLVRMSGDVELSRDVLQESFTKYLERYGRKRFSLPLLYTIARNAFFDVARKHKQVAEMPPERDIPGPDPEQEMLVRQEYRRVIEALQHLNPTEREVLSLVVSSGLSYSEIARIVGLSESNVKVKVHRARLQLRTILKADG